MWHCLIWTIKIPTKNYFFVQKHGDVDAAAEDDFEPAGGFVKRMDTILDQLKTLENNFNIDTVEKVRLSTEWLVRFALSVSKACPRDEAEIFDACRNIVSELESLKNVDRLIGATMLRDALEGAEHAVNVALLRLIVSTFSRSHLPMDLLIADIVGTSTDRQKGVTSLPTEMNSMIESIDDHNDELFHAAHFAR